MMEEVGDISEDNYQSIKDSNFIPVIDTYSTGRSSSGVSGDGVQGKEITLPSFPGLEDKSDYLVTDQKTKLYAGAVEVHGHVPVTWEENGIKKLTILPGNPEDTDFARAGGTVPPELLEKVRGKLPLDKIGLLFVNSLDKEEALNIRKILDMPRVSAGANCPIYLGVCIGDNYGDKYLRYFFDANFKVGSYIKLVHTGALCAEIIIPVTATKGRVLYAHVVRSNN